jgi:hypothetical protein
MGSNPQHSVHAPLRRSGTCCPSSRQHPRQRPIVRLSGCPTPAGSALHLTTSARPCAKHCAPRHVATQASQNCSYLPTRMNQNAHTSIGAPAPAPAHPTVTTLHSHPLLLAHPAQNTAASTRAAVLPPPRRSFWKATLARVPHPPALSRDPASLRSSKEELTTLGSTPSVHLASRYAGYPTRTYHCSASLSPHRWQPSRPQSCRDSYGPLAH